MAKNNFDDFLLDPSYDDLDALHLEAERQLYKKGGIKKLVKKVKNKLTSKKNKKSGTSTTDAQAAQIEKVASKTPAGNRSTTYKKPPTVTPKRKPGSKIEAPKPKVEVKAPAAKKIEVKKKSFSEAFKENRKMLGPGKTFTWNGKKYSTNTKDDLAKKPKAATSSKPKINTGNSGVSQDLAKRLTSKNYADKIPRGGNKMGSGGLKKMKYKKGGKR